MSISDILLTLGNVLNDVKHCFLIHYGVAITDTKTIMEYLAGS